MRLGSSILVAIAGMTLTACNWSSSGHADDAEHYRKWMQNAPPSYSYRVMRSCECLPEWVGPVDIVVRNGVVYSRTYMRSQEPVDPAKFWDRFAVVDSLFSRLRAIRLSDPISLEVEYDKQWGFPTLINVDAEARVSDGGFTYVVSNFRVLSASSQD